MVSDEESYDNLASEELNGWTTEEATNFKIDEMKTAKREWKKKIKRNNKIYQTLHEIDSILREEDVKLRFQVSGGDYNEKTFQDSGISELTLRIANRTAGIRDIENNFFQSIKKDKLTRVKNTPIRFEIEDSYDETVRIIEEDFSNIELEIPTIESFFTTRIEEKMDSMEE